MKSKENTGKLKIIPLGGLGEIGMNITAFEYGDSIIVVDCGLAFPEDDMLGIDFVIPDVTYLQENYSKVKGFVITHGHEDLIGAIPYVFQKLNVPIYATKLTMKLIEKKLDEHNMSSPSSGNRPLGQSHQSRGFGLNTSDEPQHSGRASLAIYSPQASLCIQRFKVDYRVLRDMNGPS